MALQFCEKGRSDGIVTKAASKLEIKESAVQKVVSALSQFYLASCKQHLSGSSLKQILKNLAKSSKKASENLDTLIRFYTENVDKIEEYLKRTVIHLPEYKHLDWRLDMEISKRTLHSRMQPHFMLQLDTLDAGSSGKTSRRYLEIDHANIKQVCDALEDAVEEHNSIHVERMKRYIQ